MKKHSVLIPFIAAALIAGTATADPVRVQADFTCPTMDMVSNFGTYIAGQGMELILSLHNPVYFKSTAYLAGVPNNLSTYSSYSTNYDSVTATVICTYASSDPTHANFDLNYYVTNGQGGRIRNQTNNTINIIFPLGFHK